MLGLTSVEIDGFLSHGNTGLIPLDQPGITSIQGATGDGKSTIFEVVFYLLTGETFRTVRLVADLANKVTNNGYDIALNYYVDKDTYRVREIRGRKGNDNELEGLYFWQNGEPIKTKKTSDLRKKILDSLKMTPNDICAISFMGQAQFHRLVYGKSTERANEIIRIYGLDQYDQALKDCGKDIEVSSDMRKALVAKLAIANVELVSLEYQLKIDDGIVVIDEGQFINLQKDIADVERALTTIRPKEGKAREDLGKVKALKEKYQLFLDIQNEIQSIRQDLNGMVDVTQSPEDLRKGLDAVRDNLAQVASTISQAKERLKSVKDLGEKCPITCDVCPVGVPDKYKNMQVAACRNVIDSKHGMLASLTAEVTELQRVIVISTTKSKLQEKLKDKTNTLQKLGDIVDIPDLSEKEQLAKKFEELVTRGTTKLKLLNDSLVQIKEKKSAYLKAQEYRERARCMMDEKNHELLAIQISLDTHDHDHQYLVTALNILKKAKAYKIDYIINLLNERVQSNLDYISDGAYQASFSSQRKDATGKKLLDSIDIVVSDSFKEIPFEMASGGQQAQVCLAVLPAIFETARMVTNKSMSSLWLDEVFGPISSDTLDRVFESLIALSERIGVSSIKVISHRNLDSRFIDYTWNVTLENGVTRLDMGAQ